LGEYRVNKEESRQKIAELVKKYESLSDKAIKAYNEANTKQAFILPLFAALGWDVFDTHEVTLEEAASNKRVDFAFKLNNVARFYLEAKPLKADLNNPDYIKQAITYAYSNGVTWAVLTNFEELRLLNAQKSTPFIQLTHKDYLSSFEKLWLLSREAIAEDALNKEAAQYGAMPPLIPIEERLFKQLRAWRGILFNELYHYNKWLKPEQRDEVIEKLFNRLIFIRTAEDRKLEEHNLRSAVHKWENGGHIKGELISALREIFTYYTNYYDSDLFKEHLLDSASLEIDGYIFKEILDGLYEIPGGIADYDFSIIDADVLGRVYEQYLGYVAKVEQEKAKEAQAQLGLGLAVEQDYQMVEKKLHRKEQGIYYTPKFVTDYIVKETVGRFIRENEADGYNKILNMKILDPACGSGSFLIRAYDELLNYHARVRGKPASLLEQQDRMPILTGNIFGVDLDRQAVEIARLNLLLRGLAKRDHLPPLTDNIKQGNSLISGMEKELKGYFGKDWKEKHPFSWEDEFKQIMAGGGFDVVIGNPPYVRIQSLPKDEADYFRSHYDSAFGSFDIYVLFIEKAIRLLKTGGQLGFITSGKFLKSDYGKKIQQMIHEQCTVEDIIDLSAQQVFAEATTYPVIVILRKGAQKKPLSYVFMPADCTQPPDIASITPVKAEQDALIKGVWPLSLTNDKLLAKLAQNTKPLGDIAERIFQGIKTSADDIYSLKLLAESGDCISAFSASLQKRVDLEKSITRPLIKTGQMKRYHIEEPEMAILFPYSNGDLLSSVELQSKYPKAWHYLNDNVGTLKKREHGAFRNEEQWYKYGRNQALKVICSPKIITPDFAPSARYSLDTTGEYFFNGGTAGGYGIIPAKGVNSLFLLGLLNSKVLDWFLQKTSSNFRGGWFSYESRFISHIPIRQIDFAMPAEKKAHDRLVSLVEKMLDMNKKLAPMRSQYSHERDELVKEIENTDREIDNLVYDLYGLTEEERQIVGGNIGV
jgi:type I restriction-modification system DNA methylase subunit